MWQVIPRAINIVFHRVRKGGRRVRVNLCHIEWGHVRKLIEAWITFVFLSSPRREKRREGTNNLSGLP